MIVGALCFVGGFFFPLLFIPAVILGWSLTATPAERREALKPEPKSSAIHRAGVGAGTPDWRGSYLEACESPAESSFLIAMIEGFSLQPQHGVLKGKGLTLDMQVGMGLYRLDFLANGWLVIEIDGAAYHTSPEAVARDKRRDAYLLSHNYTVLRIPAKVVFSTPAQAVAMVRTSLAEGRKVADQSSSKQQAGVSEPAPARATLGNILKETGKFFDDLNAHVSEAAAVQSALAKPKAVFNAEKTAIQSALASAESNLEMEAYRARSPQHAEDFDRANSRLDAILAKHRDGGDRSAELRRQMRASVVAIEAPSPHADPAINESIQRHYRSLMKERAEYFGTVRNQLKSKERMRILVKARLEEMGCPSCWNAIA